MVVTQRTHPGNRSVDLVTFEVLRHRLWEINDEMGLIAVRISGSPAVYESNDFNTAILTGDGRGLFVGTYVIRQSAALNLVVQGVLERFKDKPGISDGDFFMTNDPWVGALHQNDVAVVAPVFWEGEIVAWTGITMHETDVGGPQPGSYCVGAYDTYQESPLMPPVRIMEKGEFKTEIEELYLRNTRTPGPNGLNLRAKIAAQIKTRERIHEIIRRYGKDTFIGIQEQILEHVRTSVRKRLRELPNGTWYETGFLDHDGHTNALYQLKLAMTKRDDRLIFDFRGTAPQAPGPINCAWSGLVGGILQIALPLLCFDLPWAAGALMDCIDIISDEGTLNNATFPAAVGMGTVNACQLTGNLVVQTLSRMYGCSDAYRNEVMATGYPGVNSAMFFGTNRDGQRFTAHFTTPVGGGGARAFRDGIDSAGTVVAPGYSIPNAERFESLYPILVLSCRERCDTPGAGKYRGGAGTEILLTPHDIATPVSVVLRSNCCSLPEAKGLFGGLPGSIQRQLVLRRSNVKNLFAAGKVPTKMEELSFGELEVCEAKGTLTIGIDDVFLNFCSGGGGVGDPLERDPALVLADLEIGLCRQEVAESQYGVVLAAGGREVDLVATADRRESIRRARLARGRQPDSSLSRGRQHGSTKRIMPAGESLEVVCSGTGYEFRCVRCSASLGSTSGDPRNAGVIIDERIDAFSPLNRYGLVEDAMVRLFCCPGCGMLYSTDVQLRAEQATAPEMRLEPVRT